MVTFESRGTAWVIVSDSVAGRRDAIDWNTRVEGYRFHGHSASDVKQIALKMEHENRRLRGGELNWPKRIPLTDPPGVVE